MSSPGAFEPLVYQRLGRAGFGVVASLELEQDQIDRFLGPLADIAEAVRIGPSHGLFAIRAAGVVVGFYVVHPDPRDAACWWLGWLALDRRQQGRGFGRAALANVMSSLRRVPGCRRVRLLVAQDNAPALRLYRQARFRTAGAASGGELVMEAVLPDGLHIGTARPAASGPRSRCGRLRASSGPHAARMIGVSRGPPAP